MNGKATDRLAIREFRREVTKEFRVFARRIRVEVIEKGGASPCPMAWLDSYAMRSFTGRSAFDDTLPVADGIIEAGFRVDFEGLRADMEDWFSRKFGQGQPIQLRIVEEPRAIQDS